MIVVEKAGMVVVGINPQGPWDFTEEITPLEAEQVIKDIRRAIDKARAACRPKRKLGEH